MAKKQQEEVEVRLHHKVVPNQIKSGDVMAITHYVKVGSYSAYNQKLVVNGLDLGVGQFDINGNTLIENMASADQYAEEVKVTQTKAAEMLISSHNRPLTVCFEKQNGEIRVLRGRLIAPEPLMGRSKVEDLDLTDDNRMRLVDHRTIAWIVVDGVRYTVK